MEPWLVVLVLGQMTFVAFLCWVAVSFWAKRERLRSEERLRLVARFASGQELAAFLDTPAGRKLLAAFGSRPPDPRRAVVRTVQLGMTLAFVGLGFITLFFFQGPGEERRVFLIPGILLMMACVGALAGAGVSALLYRRSGLASRNDDRRPPEA